MRPHGRIRRKGYCGTRDAARLCAAKLHACSRRGCPCQRQAAHCTRRKDTQITAQMWASPGADVGQSRRRCGPVPAQMWGNHCQGRCGQSRQRWPKRHGYCFTVKFSRYERPSMMPTCSIRAGKLRSSATRTTDPRRRAQVCARPLSGLARRAHCSAVTHAVSRVFSGCSGLTPHCSGEDRRWMCRSCCTAFRARPPASS